MTTGELRALTARVEAFACSDILPVLVDEDGVMHDLRFYGWKIEPVPLNSEGKRVDGEKPVMVLAWKLKKE